MGGQFPFLLLHPALSANLHGDQGYQRAKLVSAEEVDLLKTLERQVRFARLPVPFPPSSPTDTPSLLR